MYKKLVIICVISMIALSQSVINIQTGVWFYVICRLLVHILLSVKSNSPSCSKLKNSIMFSILLQLTGNKLTVKDLEKSLIFRSKLLQDTTIKSPSKLNQINLTVKLLLWFSSSHGAILWKLPMPGNNPNKEEILNQIDYYSLTIFHITFHSQKSKYSHMNCKFSIL